MIQLDSTGPQYVQIQPHPYFTKAQPQWQKPYYPTGNIALNYSAPYEGPRTASTYTDANVIGKQKLWPYLGL